MQPNNLTATIWLSPYRISYTTCDHEFCGAINRPDPDLLQKTLKRLYAYLIVEGYSPLILHMER
jgi:hypothetical protein